VYESDSFSKENQSPSSSTDPGEMRDITGIEDIPKVPSRPWWPYALAMAAATVMSLFLVGWKYGRRFWGEKEPAPGPWALAELQRVDSLDLLESDQVEKYHALYSNVIRQYLERRFNLRASHQTTQEFLQAMGSSPVLNSIQKDLLSAFLERCDLAKFAKVRFRKEECLALGQSARLFVEKTTTGTEEQEAS
jgi:hypothetical protein